MNKTEKQLDSDELMQMQPCICSMADSRPNCLKCMHNKPHHWNRSICDHFTCFGVMAFCIPDNIVVILEGEQCL